MKIPLVLVSGLLSNEHLWRHQLDHLTHLTSIQVISPSENTPEKMIQEVLEIAPTQFALAGHSMGGWLCLEIMRIAPARVTKLCLINTTSRMDSSEKRKRREEWIVKAEKNFPAVVNELVNHFVYNSSVKKNVETMFLEVGKEVFISQEQSMMKRQSTNSIPISCPAFVIHAAQDHNFSLTEHQELVDQIPNAKLAVVEDAGHISPIEAPQTITALMRLWLTYF